MVLFWHVWEITPIMSLCLLLKPASLISCKFFCPKLNWFCTAKINSSPETRKKMFMWLRCIFIEFLIGWWDPEGQQSSFWWIQWPFFSSLKWEVFISTMKLSGLVYRWLIFVIFLISICVFLDEILRLHV